MIDLEIILQCHLYDNRKQMCSFKSTITIKMCELGGHCIGKMGTMAKTMRLY